MSVVAHGPLVFPIRFCLWYRATKLSSDRLLAVLNPSNTPGNVVIWLKAINSKSVATQSGLSNLIFKYLNTKSASNQFKISVYTILILPLQTTGDRLTHKCIFPIYQISDYCQDHETEEIHQSRRAFLSTASFEHCSPSGYCTFNVSTRLAISFPLQ